MEFCLIKPKITNIYEEPKPYKRVPKSKNKIYTLKKRIEIVDEVIKYKNMKEIAKKYNVLPIQICNWEKRRKEYLKMIKIRPNATNITRGGQVTEEYKVVEEKLLTWIQECINKKIYLSAKQIIQKSLSLNSKFHKGKMQSLLRWLYRFLKRNKLKIRTINSQTKMLLKEQNKQKINDMINEFNEKLNIGHTINDLMELLKINNNDNECNIISLIHDFNNIL